MTVVQFLTSPDGVLLEHAIVLLVVAVIGYFTARIHGQTKAIERNVNGRMNRLEQEIASTKGASQSPAPAEPFSQ